MKMNQKGISLVQILVAIAILGGLAFVIARLSQDATKVTTNVETNNDITSALQQIQAILSDPESCTATFQGRRANNAANVVQALRLKYNNVFTNAFETKTLNPNISYGQQQLKINSYSLSDADDEVDVPTLSTTHLLINFDRGTKGAQAQSIIKKVNLRVVVNASGDIVSCTAFSSASSELWKYTTNNTDIFYSGGNVSVGTTAPAGNLTVRTSTLPLTAGIGIIGSEGSVTGWHRANVTFHDQSSTHAWSIAMYGSASSEGEGKVGINGGPKGAPLPNKFIITKEGDVGLGTTAPYKGFNCIPAIQCPNSIDFQVHNNSTDPLFGGSNIMLSSNATANGSIVGALALGTMGSINTEKRVAVITAQIGNFSPLRGNLIFWTANNGTLGLNMSLNHLGDLWNQGHISTSNLIVSSDQRLKKDIRPIESSLEKIILLQPVSFNWKNESFSSKKIGFVAQQVEKFFPHLVKEDAKGIKSVAYTDLIAPIVNAVKELNDLISDRQQDIEGLKKETLEIKRQLCSRDPQAEFCGEAL